MAVSRDRAFALCCTALLGASLGVHALELRRIRALSASVETLSPRSGVPEIGSILPAIRARDLAGQSVQLSYGRDQPPTVVYVFSPSCVWCKRNLANIESLVSRTRGHYRFIGVSLSRSGLTTSPAAFPFPIFTDISSETSAAYGLGATPQTIVLTNEGRVLKAWSGAFSGQTQADVERFFKVRLPGLLDLGQVLQHGTEASF